MPGPGSQLAKHIEFCVERLSPEARTAIGQPGEPQRPVLRTVNACAGSTDRARAEEGLQPEHCTRRVFDEVHVRACQFLQCEPITAAMVNGSQVAGEQPV